MTNVILNYFFGSSEGNAKKNDDLPTSLASAAKESRPAQQISDKTDQFPGAVQMALEAVQTAAERTMAKPITIPPAAGGDAAKFYPRQVIIMDTQYQDRDGRLCIKTGRPCFEIMQAVETPNDGLSIIDLKTATDLGLIPEEAKQTNVLQELDAAKTRMGSCYFQRAIATATPDFAQVQRRQAVARHLLGDQETKAALVEALEEMAPGEVALLSTKDGSKALPGAMNSLYCKMHPTCNKRLNASALTLDFNAVSTTIQKGTKVIVQGVGTVAFAAFAYYEAARWVTEEDSDPEALANFSNRFISSTPLGVLGGVVLMLEHPAVNSVAGIAGAYFSASSLRGTYDWFINDTRMLFLCRDSISQIATYYKGMKKIHEILSLHPEIAQNLHSFDSFDAFMRNSDDKESLNLLFGLLESFSFAPNNQILFRPGEVLLAWDLLHSGEVGKIHYHEKRGAAEEGESKKGGAKKGKPALGDEVRKAFDEALYFIGELDATISIATLIADSKECGVKYCLTDFDEETTTLDLQNVWHPAFGKDKAIPNSIRLGQNAPSMGALIAGKTTGGKSSFAQATALSIITSRMGFCAAEKATMSHFSLVRTSMKIRDSVDLGDSSWQAQMELLKAMHDGILNLEGKPCFVLLDEACNQTNEQAGYAMLSSYVQALATSPGVISMVVSHKEKLQATLGDKEENGATVLRNYQISQGGRYQLEPGIYTPDANDSFATAEKVGVDAKVIQGARDQLHRETSA